VNVDWVIPCRFAEVHDNLATIVGAGIDTWWLGEFPAPVQVVMAVRLLATADELGPDHQHQLGNVVRDPSGEPISELTSAFQAATADQVSQARPDWLNGIAMVFAVQFEATEPGTYTFDFTIDGASKSVPLHVAQGPPPGMLPLG
jgi:hypothetical protein